MGLFCVNFHFRTMDDKALAEALDRRGVGHYHIAPAKGGWTSLYEEQASEQDDRRIRELGGGLSRDLHVPCIAFLVHDSDVACYWLFDNGELLDEYNSDPGYFDSHTDARPSPSGGHADVLARYCQPGVTPFELASMLGEKRVRETVFADEVIRRLARALGIDRGRAIADYRDMDGDGGPGGWDGGDEDDDDDNDDDEGGGPGSPAVRAGLVERLAKRFGFDAGSAPADPRSTALVEAAARGDTDEIDRLLAEGVAVDGVAPAPIPVGAMNPGLAQLFPGGRPQMVMTPLLAAIAHKQRAAVLRLLKGGADPGRVDPHWGTAVHAATGSGDVEMLRLLIEQGADVNARSAHGQTPLQALSASRAAVDRLAQVQGMMKSMGLRLPAHLANVSLPTEGWDACEQLLKEHGAE